RRHPVDRTREIAEGRKPKITIVTGRDICARIRYKRLHRACRRDKSDTAQIDQEPNISVRTECQGLQSLAERRWKFSYRAGRGKPADSGCLVWKHTSDV